MFHFFQGKLKEHGDELYLENDNFGILVEYIGDQKKGARYLHPLIDPNRHTIKYYAFDKHRQKTRFLDLCKIQGIGGKSGYQIAMQDDKNFTKAIQNFDIKYFTTIPGIGPKTAKRILVELKTSVGKSDMDKLKINDKLLKDILKSLHDLGYERSKVKEALALCTVQLEKENLPEIMKRLVNNL